MSGSLRSRSAGSWELKFEAPADAAGKRKTVYRTFKGTKREAQAKLVELQSEAARGGLIDHSKESLGGFLIRWDRDWAAINVSPKTRERWAQLAPIAPGSRPRADLGADPAKPGDGSPPASPPRHGDRNSKRSGDRRQFAPSGSGRQRSRRCLRTAQARRECRAVDRG
jgi:hypothetical protein